MSIVEEPGAARAGESAPALGRDILDALTTLIKQAEPIWHSIADCFGVAPPHLLAMFKLEGGLAMKDLAQRLGCDASFVTAIADNLEKRGFLRREPGLRDRRVKNLVLTEEGLAAKDRLMTQLAAKMPWCYALDEEERQCFLGLLRKMLAAPLPDTAGNGCLPHDHGTPGPQGEAASRHGEGRRVRR